MQATISTSNPAATASYGATCFRRGSTAPLEQRAKDSAARRTALEESLAALAARSEACRTEIAAIRKAKGFAIVEENKLKRVPTGFPADSEYAEMLKLKDFYIAKKITEEFLLSDDLLERTLAEFRRTQPFIAILNRAVQFAYEEMM